MTTTTLPPTDDRGAALPHLELSALRAGDPANPLLSAYGYNALKGWLRAHPVLAARHHPDLVQPTTTQETR